MRGEAAGKLLVALPFVSSASDPSTIMRSASAGRHGPQTLQDDRHPTSRGIARKAADRATIMVYECVLPYTFARLAHSLEDGLHKLCLRYVMQAVGSSCVEPFSDPFRAAAREHIYSTRLTSPSIKLNESHSPTPRRSRLVSSPCARRVLYTNLSSRRAHKHTFLRIDLDVDEFIAGFPTGCFIHGFIV